MNTQGSPASLEGGRAQYMRCDRFEINQYVRVQVSETRFAIGVVTAIDEDQDKATVETRNGYDVTLPISALRRAFLVVLDLNGVLVARGRGSFILRPHVLEFLKFVFSNFVVAVWTSGLQRSSNPIIEHVFGSYRDLLLFTLYRDACVPKATAENPYGTEKNLQTIFDRYPLSFHAVNTIIIDDSPDKCSHPDIALCPVPFKDPVGQSQDNGLLETMETLRQVLLLDSGAPLILAAEERLHRLAEQQAQERQQQAAAAPAQAERSSTTPPSVNAGASPSSVNEPPHSPDNTEAPTEMEEVELWKTRLCCDNLQGRCTRGSKCPFSHDPDDGRPCSRKDHCRHHGSRWPKTSEEAAYEAKRRQIREAKQQQQRKIELEKRQQEQHGSRGGQTRRQSDILLQLQRRQQQSSSSASQRQRGGRSRQDRQYRGSRHEEGWEEALEDNEEDWASGPTGLSHTGDPAYDNMINERQRRAMTSSADRAPQNLNSCTVNVVQERRYDVGGSASVSGNSAHTGNTSGGNSSHLSSGYRRQLQHHSNSNANVNPHDACVPSHEQQQLLLLQSFGQADRSTAALAAEPVPFFFQSSSGTMVTTATTIEPFSTRPIAPSPTSVQPSTVPISFSQQPMSSLSSMLTAAQSRSFGTGDIYRGMQSQQQPQSCASTFGSSSQPQAIRISGSQDDASAVVSQLQALLRKS